MAPKGPQKASEKCPKCQSPKIIYHFWGLPIPGVVEEMESRGISVKVYGCLVRFDEKNTLSFPYECDECGHQWNEEGDSRG